MSLYSQGEARVSEDLRVDSCKVLLRGLHTTAVQTLEQVQAGNQSNKEAYSVRSDSYDVVQKASQNREFSLQWMIYLKNKIFKKTKIVEFGKYHLLFSSCTSIMYGNLFRNPLWMSGQQLYGIRKIKCSYFWWPPPNPNYGAVFNWASRHFQISWAWRLVRLKRRDLRKSPWIRDHFF